MPLPPHPLDDVASVYDSPRSCRAGRGWPRTVCDMRLLFVCTGNVCRSPLAERLASGWAEQALGAGAAVVHIRSAGIEALDGRSMEPRSAAALRQLGGDPTGFTAQTFIPQMAEQADLVLTMTRHQRRKVIGLVPRALRRTFTLPEAAALLDLTDLHGVTDLPLRDRALELATRLNTGRARRRSVEADDVFDPIGQSPGVHQKVAARIARKLEPISDVLFHEDRSGAVWGHTPPAARRPNLPPVPPLTPVPR
jgi:protein-tyrosine phosphatase